MTYNINGVLCDAFAHVDSRTVSDTVRFSLSEREDYLLTVFLFCDKKPFPVDTSLTAECCIKGNTDKQTVNCSVDASGAIIVPVPTAFCVPQEILYCEINISGEDTDGASFRYKSADFIVAVIE